MEYSSAKLALSYGRANRVSYISLLFLTPWVAAILKLENQSLWQKLNSFVSAKPETN